MRHLLAGSALLGLLAAGLPMGCGGEVVLDATTAPDKANPPSEEPVPGYTEALCAEFEAALSDTLDECTGVPPFRSQPFFYYDLSDRCSDALRAPGTGWTASGVEACTAEARLTCSTSRSACAELFNAPGVYEEGAPCSMGEQCTSQSCSASGDACGACLPDPQIGDQCAADTHCGPQMRCTNAGICANFPAARTRGEADPCVYDAECALGLVCSMFPGATSGACAPERAEGSTCRHNDCGAGFGCRLTPDSDDGVCTKRLARGESCTLTNDLCVWGTNCVAIVYGTQPVCAKPGAPGEICSFDLQCASGSYCPVEHSTMSGACEPRGADGAACKTDKACQEGLLCGDKVCVKEPPALGEACTRACAKGTECVSGVCTALPVIGEPCTGYCAEGAYCDYFQNQICAKKKSLGEACTAWADVPSSDECESGYCGGSVCAESTWASRHIGESCVAQSECAEGACVGAGSAGICTAEVGIGEPCAARQGDAIIPRGVCGQICDDGICESRAEACD